MLVAYNICICYTLNNRIPWQGLGEIMKEILI